MFDSIKVETCQNEAEKCTTIDTLGRYIGFKNNDKACAEEDLWCEGFKDASIVPLPKLWSDWTKCDCVSDWVLQFRVTYHFKVYVLSQLITVLDVS